MQESMRQIKGVTLVIDMRGVRNGEVIGEEDEENNPNVEVIVEHEMVKQENYNAEDAEMKVLEGQPTSDGNSGENNNAITKVEEPEEDKEDELMLEEEPKSPSKESQAVP